MLPGGLDHLSARPERREVFADPVGRTSTPCKLVDDSAACTAHLELRLTPGIQAYSFTFGWTRTRSEPDVVGTGRPTTRVVTSVRRPVTVPVPA